MTRATLLRCPGGATGDVPVGEPSGRAVGVIPRYAFAGDYAVHEDRRRVVLDGRSAEGGWRG